MNNLLLMLLDKKLQVGITKKSWLQPAYYMYSEMQNM